MDVGKTFGYVCPFDRLAFEAIEVGLGGLVFGC